MGSLQQRVILFCVGLTLMCSAVSHASATDDEASAAASSPHYHRSQYAPLSPVDCLLDDDGTNRAVNEALHIGETAVDRFYAEVRRHHRNGFRNVSHVCRYFRDYIERMSLILDTCDGIAHSLEKKWIDLHDRMQCVCVQQDYDCRQDMRCLQDELSRIPARHCEEMYKFNTRQHQINKCPFLEEMVGCKDSLVRSRCGDRSADLGLVIMRTSHRYHLNHHHPCYITRPAELQDVAYTEECPWNLTNKIYRCHQKYLNDDVRYPLEHPVVIYDGRKRDINNICIAVDEYEACIEQHASQCKPAVQRYYQQDFYLRTFLSKAKYVCGENKRTYKKKLQCFKEQYRSRAVEACVPVTKELQPVLKNTSEYTIYCEPDAPETQQIRAGLERVLQCDETVFRRNCSEDGARVMVDLLRLVYDDPGFLIRPESHRPDCELHRRALQYTPPPPGSLPPDGYTKTGTLTQQQQDAAGGGAVDDTDEEDAGDKVTREITSPQQRSQHSNGGATSATGVGALQRVVLTCVLCWWWCGWCSVNVR